MSGHGGATDLHGHLPLASVRVCTRAGHEPARASDEFLAANPRARAADIPAAFRDPDVDDVLATIGGWEQLRILQHLDPAAGRIALSA